MPISDTQKSLIATALVIVAVFSAVGGSNLRDRMEAGANVSSGNPLSNNWIVANQEGSTKDSGNTNGLIDESAYFYQLTELLEKDYVEPITDPRTLAVGAVRGMVSSLKDSYSVFYKPEQMAVLTALTNGTYSGIGVDLRFDYGGKEGSVIATDQAGIIFPTVIVTSVAPGSPAEMAGLKFGDRLLKVNGKWSISHKDIDLLQLQRKKLDEGKSTLAEFELSVERYRIMFEKATSAMRVSDAVTMGDSGNVDLSWVGIDGIEHSAVISKQKTIVDPISNQSVRFFKGASSQFSELLKVQAPITLDLRNSTLGDFAEMVNCLELVVPRGKYGKIERTNRGEALAIEIIKGSTRNYEIKLIVDESTRGAAQIFAHVLVNAGIGVIIRGSLSDETPWIETFKLPDGSGYTLHTGDFRGAK